MPSLIACGFGSKRILTTPVTVAAAAKAKETAATAAVVSC